MNKKQAYIKFKYIPYQKCPVCDGKGRVFNGMLEPFEPTLRIGWNTCHCCEGRGIIPMHEIKTK